MAIARQCKAASYSVQDHVLINHAIKAGPAELIEHCISGCIEHTGCHSSNFYRISKWCELNDKTHASHPVDMRQVPLTNYMETTLRPLTCNKDSDCGKNLICFLSKCEVCSIHALGMESNALPNSAITASSVWTKHPGHHPWQARLNNVPKHRSTGSWSAKFNKAGEWLQVDLGEERLLTKLATQGRPSWSPPQWVTSFKILFSTDSIDVKWEEYKENNVVKVFTANSDRNIIVSHVLTPRFRARYVRFVVLTWHNHISMRVEHYGCSAP
ncbi:lactadherin-like [Porites lutea]|uniref:lactadherin-like n=1 Tax=Porites lutea TaxID=51062 RepID=UPI003CC545A7